MYHMIGLSFLFFFFSDFIFISLDLSFMRVSYYYFWFKFMNKSFDISYLRFCIGYISLPIFKNIVYFHFFIYFLVNLFLILNIISTFQLSVLNFKNTLHYLFSGPPTRVSKQQDDSNFRLPFLYACIFIYLFFLVAHKIFGSAYTHDNNSILKFVLHPYITIYCHLIHTFKLHRPTKTPLI